MSARHEPAQAVDLRLVDGRSLRVSNRRTIEGGIVEVIWDLTEDEKRAEEVRLARAEAEAASAAKSEFLSSMSHELRTPMNAILGFAQLIQRDKKEPISERQRDRIEHILKGGEYLLRLIDDILDLARIEAGRVSVSIEPVSLVEVLAQVRETLGPMAARSGITLEVKMADGKLPFVYADRVRFAQILMNFGSNAIKYNRPDGEVCFRVEPLSTGQVRVSVEDTGGGIPLEKQAKLFQPFQRAGQETGPIQGTGIGLVITKRLAELMGASIGFKSVPGAGSSFWVDMPLHVASAPPSVERRQAGSLMLSEGARSVLYVEDNPANIEFIRELLGMFDGVSLITAATAEEGVALAERALPGVILMDINLPGMSGFDALHALRAMPATRDIPVIALTAAASERNRKDGEQAGFFRYLTKPVNVDALLAALDEVFAAKAE